MQCLLLRFKLHLLERFVALATNYHVLRTYRDRYGVSVVWIFTALQEVTLLGKSSRPWNNHAVTFARILVATRDDWNWRFYSALRLLRVSLVSNLAWTIDRAIDEHCNGWRRSGVHLRAWVDQLRIYQRLLGLGRRTVSLLTVCAGARNGTVW